ncbi:MAG TPA: hypothetical protein VEF34_12880 [Syntrophobacteraceae bacterium]|nr:hypothetical protein [Syntrophobacteraceae bacterium]
MRIFKKNFFWQGLVLIIFSGSLLSPYALCRSGPQTDADKLWAGESPGHKASYAQYAEIIAGIRAPQSTLATFENRPGWSEFAKSFDRNWDKYEKKQLAPMRDWAAKELAAPISEGASVFYPFSGPDLINPYILFPNAATYILAALEPIGKVPDFQAMSQKDFDSFFADLQKSLHDLLSVDYFISAHMQAAMQSKELNGVLPIFLFFLARQRAHILEVEYWFMEPDGTIQRVPAPNKDKERLAGIVPGVRIVFESADSPGNRPQTLYYFRLNLINSKFEKNGHFASFLKSFGPFITFMKSASYVMFDPQLSIARQFVLDQSRYILQEDSGIPFKYFDPSVWSLQFYGVYKEPISMFKYGRQADLAKVYATGSNIGPLPFGIGYHYKAGTANLLLATRK